MKTLVFGLFKNSKRAENVVAELKDKGYAKNISVVAPEEISQPEMQIKHDVFTEVSTVTLFGAVMGAAFALLTGVSTVVLPGIGVVMGNQLTAVLSLTGAIVGALTGALIGAKLYNVRLRKDEVLIGVSTDEQRSTDVQSILIKHI